MGIKDLFKIIKKYAPELLVKFSLNEWRGHSFAVDISIFLNKYIKSAGPVYWMSTFFLFLCTLKKHGIKMICIFDGIHTPIEKKIEQQSRIDGAEKAKRRLKRSTEIRDLIIKNYMPKDIILPENIQEECKILLGSRLKRPIKFHECTDVYDALNELIGRLERQTSPIIDAQREKAWEIVNMMGIPCFQADGEAEALCSYLSIYDYVDGVLSEDSDVIALGSPWMIAFKDYKLADEKVYGIYTPFLLEKLNYDIFEFRDLCILLGCDYNKHGKVFGFPPDGKKRKKAVSVRGMTAAMTLIDKCRNLENMQEYIEDMTPLNYVRCRELFSTPTTKEMEELIKIKPYNGRPDIQKIREFVARENITLDIAYIEKCWESPEVIIHYEEEKSSSSSSSTDEDSSSSLSKENENLSSSSSSESSSSSLSKGNENSLSSSSSESSSE